MRTAAGTFLVSADLKMDPTPLDGRLTDLRAMGRLGEKGVDLLCAIPQMPRFRGFRVRKNPCGLQYVNPCVQPRVGSFATFASHIHRVQHIINAAEVNMRKVALVGRSMNRNMGIAWDLGYLKVPDGILIDYKEALAMPPHRVVFVCTGSQGETMAVLNRIITGNHEIEASETDRLVLASSLVPGMRFW